MAQKCCFVKCRSLFFLISSEVNAIRSNTALKEYKAVKEPNLHEAGRKG